MYKKGDHIAFMSKQPHFHLNEMFGHNHLTVDDFEKASKRLILLVKIICVGFEAPRKVDTKGRKNSY